MAVKAAFTLPVKMEDESPNGVPLFTSTASARDFTRTKLTTGPKISSCATRMSERTSVSTVGWKKNPWSSPAPLARAPPVATFAPSSAPTFM